MVEPTQDREGEDLAALGIWWQWLWSLLLDALMRPGSVEVAYISVEYPLKLFLMQDEQMIETLTPYTAKEPVMATWCIRS